MSSSRLLLIAFSSFQPPSTTPSTTHPLPPAHDSARENTRIVGEQLHRVLLMYATFVYRRGGGVGEDGGGTLTRWGVTLLLLLVWGAVG